MKHERLGSMKGTGPQPDMTAGQDYRRTCGDRNTGACGRLFRCKHRASLAQEIAGHQPPCHLEDRESCTSARLVAQRATSDSPLAILLSALPTAALMLDAGGYVLQANSAACAILSAGDGVRETPERHLRATRPEDDEKLALAIHAAQATGQDGKAAERRVVQVRGSGDVSLLIVLDPIAPQTDAPANEVARLLLRMIDARDPPHDRTYPLQAAFDLTAAELRVAALIATGLSPAQAARRLDVSTNTVRTHLLRVFDKTGVRSQHALTLLMAASGSWPIP